MTNRRRSTDDRRVRRTISDGSEAERRRLRASRSVARWSSSTRYTTVSTIGLYCYFYYYYYYQWR